MAAVQGLPSEDGTSESEIKQRRERKAKRKPKEGEIDEVATVNNAENTKRIVEDPRAWWGKGGTREYRGEENR